MVKKRPVILCEQLTTLLGWYKKASQVTLLSQVRPFDGTYEFKMVYFLSV